MADTLMYISNNETQNYPFFRLQLVVKTFWTLNFMNLPFKIEVPKADIITKSLTPQPHCIAFTVSQTQESKVIRQWPIN